MNYGDFKDFPKIKFDNLIVPEDVTSKQGICTLWTDPKKYRYHCNYALLGNLYSKHGIFYMLYNIAYSNIKYLIIITDNDKTKLVPELEKIKAGDPTWKTRLGEYYKVVEAIDFLFMTEQEFMDNIYSEVYSDKVIIGQDVRECFIEIEDHPCEIQETYAPESSSPGHLIKESDPELAWKKVLYKVMTLGSIENNTREIKNVLTVTKPTIIENEKFIDPDYVKSMLSRKLPKDTSYTYGSRMRDHKVTKGAGYPFEKFNQITWAIERLKKDPGTRQIHIDLWDIADDWISGSPPCLTGITLLCRDNKLDLTAHFRSHDIFRAWLNNYVAMSSLAIEIAQEAGIEKLGYISVLSQSAHVYGHDWREAYEELKNTDNRLEFDSTTVSFMKHGDIINVLVADIQGNTIESFASDSKFHIRRRLEHYITSIQHALYVGQQLERI